MDSPNQTLVGRAKPWVAWASTGFAIGIMFCAIWWILLANDLAPLDHVEELVIPAGTADAIERGVPFAFVPDRFSLPPGGRLRVVNNDSVRHTVGEAEIPSGASADIEASESGQLVCTIHPSGHLDIGVESQPPVAGMALLVVVLSLATVATGWVLR
jgi:plastocyanin